MRWCGLIHLTQDMVHRPTLVSMVTKVKEFLHWLMHYQLVKKDRSMEVHILRTDNGCSWLSNVLWCFQCRVFRPCYQGNKRRLQRSCSSPAEDADCIAPLPPQVNQSNPLESRSLLRPIYTSYLYPKRTQRAWTGNSPPQLIYLTSSENLSCLRFPSLPKYDPTGREKYSALSCLR
jgi:hypothetical protein